MHANIEIPVEELTFPAFFAYLREAQPKLPNYRHEPTAPILDEIKGEQNLKPLRTVRPKTKMAVLTALVGERFWEDFKAQTSDEACGITRWFDHNNGRLLIETPSAEEIQIRLLSCSVEDAILEIVINCDSAVSKWTFNALKNYVSRSQESPYFYISAYRQLDELFITSDVARISRPGVLKGRGMSLYGALLHANISPHMFYHFHGGLQNAMLKNLLTALLPVQLLDDAAQSLRMKASAEFIEDLATPGLDYVENAARLNIDLMLKAFSSLMQDGQRRVKLLDPSKHRLAATTNSYEMRIKLSALRNLYNKLQELDGDTTGCPFRHVNVQSNIEASDSNQYKNAISDMRGWTNRFTNRVCYPALSHNLRIK